MPIADTDNEAIMEAKSNLEIALGHQVHILREILASMKNEHQALKDENYHVLQGFEEQRSPLFTSFERWKNVFYDAVSKIGQNTDFSEQPLLAEGLSGLREILASDDIELLVLQEQVNAILIEIQNESKATQHFLEDQSIPVDLMPIYAPDVSSKLSKVAIGLIDPEDEAEII